MKGKLSVDMNLIYKALEENFDFTSFREGQFEIISSIMGKKDTFVIKSTGGGKSLCYQLPSLLLKGLTVVISPLISLMEDQVREARKQGRKDVIAIHSGLKNSEKEWVLNHLAHYRLIYLSPEGIQRQEVLEALRSRTVELLVIDEAHCISQWGHDFRLEYLQLATIRRRLGNPTCLALTATATEEVKQDVITYLELHEPDLYTYTVDRPNIALLVERVDSEQEKLEKIIQFLHKRRDAGMLYFSSRSKAEEITQRLMEEGISDIAYYHGGMSSEERNMIQQQFLEGELRLICATNAFGMGVNKPNIRFVIHYHFPSQLEAFVQEIGRCSRDGAPALSYLFVQEGDEQIPYRFLEQEFLEEGKLVKLIQILRYTYVHQRVISIQELLFQLECTEQALSFVLHQLEKIKACRYQAGKAELRVLNHLDSSLFTLLYEKVELQRKKRLKKIAEMYYWLHLPTEGCRRSYILEYFGEKKSSMSVEGDRAGILSKGINLSSGTNLSSPPCCDLCGIHPEWLAQDVDAIHVDKGAGDGFYSNKSDDSRKCKEEQADWKQRLDKLWPV